MQFLCFVDRFVSRYRVWYWTGIEPIFFSLASWFFSHVLDNVYLLIRPFSFKWSIGYFPKVRTIMLNSQKILVIRNQRLIFSFYLIKISNFIKFLSMRNSLITLQSDHMKYYSSRKYFWLKKKRKRQNFEGKKLNV